MKLASLGRTARWAAIFAAAVCCLMVFAGEADAAWIAPFGISSVGVQVADPQVAADGQGDVIVAWTSGTGNTGIMVAEHGAGGVWFAPVERIPSSFDCHDPRLAVNSAGAAVLVAACDAGSAQIRSASRAAVGGWSTSVPITGTNGGTEPRVGIDGNGNAAMDFAGAGGETVWGGYLAAGGSWSVQQLSTSMKKAVEPNLAMTSAGTADAAWLEEKSAGVVNVMLAQKSGAGTWPITPSPLTTGTTNPVAFGEPQVATSGSWQIVGWHQNPQVGSDFFEERTASLALGGFAEPATKLFDTGNVEQLALGIDSSGRSVAAWLGSAASFPANFEIRGSTTSTSNGSWATPSVLGELEVGGESKSDLAVDAAGTATIVWFGNGGVVRAATRAAGAAFGPSTTISTAGQTAVAVPAASAVLSDGIAAWPSLNGGAHIALAINDVTPPNISAASPLSGTVGTPVALSATASDVWGFPSVKWDFGDGATATGSSVSHTYASAGTKTATVTATDGAGNSASAAVTVVVTDPSAGGGGGGGAGGSGGSGAGGGQGGTENPPPSSSAHRPIKVTAAPVPQPWAKQAKAKAIQVKCKLDVNGTCAAVATVTKGVAKKLGLAVSKGKKPVRIGSGSVAATAGRFALVKVKLTAKALAAIAASPQPVSVAIAIEGIGAGDPGTATTRLTLHP